MRVEIVGNSLNKPSCRFEKARANDMSLATVSDNVIEYVDEDGYDFIVDISSLQAVDPTLPKTIYASGKGIGKPVYQKRTGLTEKIMLKNSQASTDVPTSAQLEALKSIVDVVLIYGTGTSKSLDIVYSSDLNSSHIASQSTARLELKLPTTVCNRLFELTFTTNVNVDMRKIIDIAVAQTITETCELLDIKDQNENSSTQSNFLPMNAIQPLHSTDLAEQESSVQPCVSTV